MKNFDKKEFEKKLATQLDENIKTFDNFFDTFQNTLDDFAPSKIKVLRYNSQPFLTKKLRKAIIARSRLRNKFNANRSRKNWNLYKKQRNVCVKILRQSKKNYYENIDVKQISDSKKFWKTIRPSFSNKTKTANTIILSEKDDIIKEEKIIAKTLNNHFTDITKSLKLKKVKSFDNKNKINDIIDYFQDRNSISKIKETFNPSQNSMFEFSLFKKEDIVFTISNLPQNKATISNDIPVTILKDSLQIYSGKLTEILNNCLEHQIFPDVLKKAEITPVFKKGNLTEKENYRPISTLSNFSKVFERLLYNQIEAFFEDKFSKFLTGFRKNHSTQHALLKMIETWKESLNKGNEVGVLFMDLSKAFDTLDHNLLISKRNKYGFNLNSLGMIRNYLSNRFQCTKVGNTKSSWRKIKTGVPQGSILGPLFFNIFINDIFLFLETSNLCNYADDNTLYSCEKNFDIVNEKLKTDFKTLQIWYRDNYLILNPDKCHYMTLGGGQAYENFTCEDTIIEKSQEEKILGVLIDDKLSFKAHITNICNKANQKLNALFRVSNSMTVNQRNLLVNSFINSNFNYCPLIWMFCDHGSNNKINRIQERAMRLTLNNYDVSFKELLALSNEPSTHQRCINFLMIEVYKFLNGLSPPIMSEILFLRQNVYNLRTFNIFSSDIPNSNRYGLNSLPYRASQLWNILPTYIKNSPSLSCFKARIKKNICMNCPCLTCRTYIPSLGYI